MKSMACVSLLVIAGASMGVGCAQNAALEVRLDLPPDSPDGLPIFVLTQPRRAAENPFMDEWRGDDLTAIELTEGERTEDHISVLSDDDATDLHIKVRFCSSASCTAIEDDMAPERWYKLDHPFYIGARTFWTVTVDSIPTERDTTASEVDRCQIRGCVDGDLSSYCRVDGRHLCE